jgi:hypothetical protein
MERGKRTGSMKQRGRVVLSFLLALVLAASAVASAHAARAPLVISGFASGPGGAPMEEALIAIPALNLSVLTDTRGAFRLVVPARVARGQRVVILATKEGFFEVKRAITLKAGGRLSQNFRLLPLR